MKKLFPMLTAGGLALLPVLYLALVYPGLPPTVPLHFGPELRPDRWGPKSDVWFPVALIAGISIGVWALFQNIHRIDPKRHGQAPSPVFGKMGFGLLLFMALLNFLMVEMTRGNTLFGKALFPLLGLLFAFTGNYIHHIKPNYFAGFRLPWTLSSDDNWRHTHRLAGRLWFGGGLLIAAACPFLPPLPAFVFFMAVTGLMVCIPLVFSYRYFKRTHKSL